MTKQIFRVGSEGAGSSQIRRIWTEKDAKKEYVSAGDNVRGKAQGGPSAMAALGVSCQGVGALSFVGKVVEAK